jgi:hypothetical protein
LIDERIVLQKLEFIAEKFVYEQDAKNSPSVGSVVRVAQNNTSNKKKLPLGNVRFKVVIAGVAADTNDVAALMCKLEDSSYFCNVVLSYSRGNEEIGIRNESSPRTGTNAVQVNEFEINCYLANYREL